MELPDREQRELEEIEQRLAEDDPKLAARLNRAAPKILLPRRRLIVIAMLVTYMVGLAAVVAGVTLSWVVLVGLGACMIVGVITGFTVQAWRTHRD